MCIDTESDPKVISWQSRVYVCLYSYVCHNMYTHMYIYIDTESYPQEVNCRVSCMYIYIRMYVTICTHTYMYMYIDTESYPQVIS